MSKNIILFTLILVSITNFSNAQKKILDHQQFDDWNEILNKQISPDGSIVSYHLAPGKGDQTMKIRNSQGNLLLSYPRGEKSQITWDSKYVIFTIKPGMDTVNILRRQKKKKEELPADSLGIWNSSDNSMTKIANIRSFKIPEKWSEWMVYELSKEKQQKDTTEAENKVEEEKNKKKKDKKVSDKNGYHLVVKHLTSTFQDTLKYITSYKLAEEGQKMIYITTGSDSILMPGAYIYNFTTRSSTPLCRAKGDYKQLAIDKDGTQIAFLSNTDTTKSRIPYFQLRYWNNSKDSATVAIDSTHHIFAEDWILSEHGNVRFSDNGEKLFFGIAPKPVLQDTTLLPEEIINVEIWHYEEGRLHTQQNIELEEDRKRSYLSWYNPSTDKAVQLASENVPSVETTPEANAGYALGISYLPYEQYVSWEGFPRRQDLYLVDLSDGKKTLIKEDLRGFGGISPEANYIFWYDAYDTSWHSYSIEKKVISELTQNIPRSVADELNDQPNYPGSYGVAGWTEDEKYVLIYDRFDIWRVEPSKDNEAINLTDTRDLFTRFRYVDLEPEEYLIKNNEPILLKAFNEKTREEGFYTLTVDRPGQPVELIIDDFSFSRPTKAKHTEDIIFTKESYSVFPDVLYSNLDFKNITKLSDANPQQREYEWGTVEVHQWTSLEGEELEGLLFKPENFDPDKKYPMISYFYERNSQYLHQHRGLEPYRSIINPTFYVSRGYVVFIPDITYKIGYPGQSAYSAVVPGVTSLIDKGFIDRDHVGIQGHSWGGYQTAYLITQTNMFAAAESGAPVSNMISAYGGIRWWTGLSRMFQYEHTQSRLGATLWEKPFRYIENSPIFYVDKIQTPLLIMHNDKDGHVPWYQGIELYVAMRRLGKPAWMLNYVDEPHWPTTYENKRDFQIRMQQFFDHYLKEQPMPVWMKKGVPAKLKGIEKGYELTEE